jgi:hypothetical protein
MGSDVPMDHAILITIQWMNFNHKIIGDMARDIKILKCATIPDESIHIGSGISSNFSRI